MEAGWSCPGQWANSRCIEEEGVRMSSSTFQINLLRNVEKAGACTNKEVGHSCVGYGPAGRSDLTFGISSRPWRKQYNELGVVSNVVSEWDPNHRCSRFSSKQVHGLLVPARLPNRWQNQMISEVSGCLTSCPTLT